MSVNSFSRLGTANAYDNTLVNLQNRQATLANLQESLSSGKKITSPSDDPTGAAQAERALNRIARIASDQRALEAQRSAITQAEGTLGDITDALQSIRELVVSAGNGAYSAAERTTIAGQISGLRDRVLSLANTRDGNGMPLFAALGSALTPFAGPQSAAPDYRFDGLPGQTATNVYAIPATLDGESAFMAQPARDGVFNIKVGNSGGGIPAGRTLTTDTITVTDKTIVGTTANLAAATAGAPVYPAYTLTVNGVDTTTTPGTTTLTYAITETPAVSTPALTTGTTSFPTGTKADIPVTVIPGLSFNFHGTPALNDTVTIAPKGSVFSVLDSAVTDIGSAANANAATQAVAQTLTNLDTCMARISAVRGQAGDLMNRAESITNINSKRNIEQESNRSRAEDIDMVKGISDFNNQQTGYQAALQTYAQIKKLSLFNFIS